MENAESPERTDRPGSVKGAVALLAAMALGMVGLAGYAVYDGLVHNTDGFMPALGMTLVYAVLAAFFGFAAKGLWEGRNTVSRGMFGALMLAPVGYFLKESGGMEAALAVWTVMILLGVALMSPSTREFVGFNDRSIGTGDE